MKVDFPIHLGHFLKKHHLRNAKIDFRIYAFFGGGIFFLRITVQSESCRKELW